MSDLTIICATGQKLPADIVHAGHVIMKQSGPGCEIGPYGPDEFPEVKTLAMRSAARGHLG